MRFVNANGAVHGVELREYDGVAPGFVFLNALGTDHRIWDEVVAQMADTSVLRYDMRGHGLSERGELPISIASLADDLRVIMDTIGMGKAILCGVSLGGMVAQQFAHRWPHRVDALALCDTAARIGSPASWDNRIRLVTEIGLANAATRFVDRWFGEPFRRRFPERLRGYRMMAARADETAYVHMAVALRDTDLAPLSHNIHCPALVLCGADDIATPPADVRRFATTIPRARFELVTESGHLPCVEQPAVLAGHLSHLRTLSHAQ